VLRAEAGRGTCGVGAFEVEDHHPRPLSGEHLGRGESEAVEACAAGDESYVVSEKHCQISDMKLR
jgi:hypothetical protein